MSGYLDIIIQKHRLMIALKAKFYAFCYKTNSYLMFIKSPKQSLGDLLFLLRFLLLLLLLLLFFLSFRAPRTCPRQISGTTGQNFMKLGGVIDICF
jgi:hypothetical protein